MKFTYLGITICLFLTTTIPNVFAEDHFLLPAPNSKYSTGSTISFLVEDMPDEDDQNVNANLHKADGSLVKTIKTWSSQSVEEGADEFPFDWLVDVTETGSYYVEIAAGSSREDIIQSYPFLIQGNTESGDASSSTPVDTNGPSSDVAPQSIQNEVQEEQEEPEEQEGQEGSARKKLSLHNQQSKVAHISSHNDIDTVSEPSSTPVQEAAPQQIPQNVQQSSSELATPASKEESEPLMPELGSNANMKELAAADDIAVEEERKWLAHQKNGSSHAPASPPSPEKKKSSSGQHSKAQQKGEKAKTDQHTKTKAVPKKTNSKGSQKVASKPSGNKTSNNKSSGNKSSYNKPSSNKVATGINNNNSDLKAQIKAKAKETVSKVKEEAQKSNEQEKQRQKLSLAQQEALDDQAIKAEMAEIKNTQSSSKEKREAYRKVMSNRARFSKRGLH